MLFSLYIQHRGNCRKEKLQKVRKVVREKERERHSKYKYRRVFIDYQSERVTKKALGLSDTMML